MSMRDDDGLDALIDRVARDMTAGDPPASLAERVRARIAPRRRSGRPERESKGAGPERPRWFLPWQPLAAAAALAVVIASAVVSWPGRPVDAPVVPGTPIVAARQPTAVRDLPTPVEDRPANTGPGLRLRRGPGGQVIRPELMAAVAAVEAMPLPAIEPLTVETIDDPVLVAEMSGLAMPIEIEPLQVAPLELQ